MTHESGSVAVGIKDSLRYLLLSSGCSGLMPDVQRTIQSWEGLDTDGADCSRCVSEQLVAETAILVAAEVAGMARQGKSADDLMRGLKILDRVLICGNEAAASRVTVQLARLDAAFECVNAEAAQYFFRPSAFVNQAVVNDMLRLPLVVLTRCVGTQAITAHEVLELSRHDLAVAVQTVVSVMEFCGSSDGRCAPANMSLRMTQVLHHLSTPDVVGSLQFSDGSLAESDSTPIQRLHERTVAIGISTALCFVQFDVLRAVVGSCCGSSSTATAASINFFHAVHNIVGHAALAASGRLMGRHFVVHFAEFGHRLLAPLMRQLLRAADDKSLAGAAAARSLRQLLRTVCWLLCHTPELRCHLCPLCLEWAMRATTGSHAGQTLALILLVVAAADGITEPVNMCMDKLNPDSKERMRTYMIREVANFPLDQYLLEPLQYLGLLQSPEVEGEPDEEDRPANVNEMYGLDFGGVLGVPWEEQEDPENEEDMNTIALGPCPWYEPSAGAFGIAISGPQTLLRTAPAEFRCSCDGRLCIEPCRSPSGILYERRNIEAWLRRNKTCPILGSALARENLVDDSVLQAQISEWLTGTP